MTGWQLWRQDDNGNSFLVGKYPSRELAELRLAELTRRQHKQIYWITESSMDNYVDVFSRGTSEPEQ